MRRAAVSVFRERRLRAGVSRRAESRYLAGNANIERKSDSMKKYILFKSEPVEGQIASPTVLPAGAISVGQASRLSLTLKNFRSSGFDSRPELNHRVADLLEDGDRRDACPTLPLQQSAPLFAAWFRLKPPWRWNMTALILPFSNLGDGIAVGDYGLVCWPKNVNTFVMPPMMIPP